MPCNLVIADRKLIHNFIAFYTHKYLIKTFYTVVFIPALISALGSYQPLPFGLPLISLLGLRSGLRSKILCNNLYVLQP